MTMVNIGFVSRIAHITTNLFQVLAKASLDVSYRILSYIRCRRLTIIKFLVVSGSAVALNLLLLYLLVSHLGFSSPLGENAANFISMELSIIYNYFMSRTITWNDRRKETGGRLFLQIVKFHAAIGITILFRLGLFPALQALGVQYIFNAAIGIAVSAIFNYVVYDIVIFKKEK
jgi:dolichol-phosphate mannosyltransferase